MFLFDVESFCKETAGVLQIVGYVLTIFKFIIPLLIVAYGMFDFGKAVVSSKDDEMKSSAKKLGFRVAAGIIIFFIPTIIMWVFGTAITIGMEDQGSFDVCETCILQPSNCKVKEQ